MNQTQWLLNKLEEISYDKEKMYEPSLYDMFITDTNSHMSYESYKRVVRKHLLKVLQKETEEIQINELDIFNHCYFIFRVFFGDGNSFCCF